MTEQYISRQPNIEEKEAYQIRDLMQKNPDWGRTRLSIELCKHWNWRYTNGNPKAISCRDLLRKLDRKKIITLPPPLRATGWKTGSRINIQEVEHSSESIDTNIKSILPVKIKIAENREEYALFNHLLAKYHYLGYDRTVGENIKYIIYSNNDKPLACLLFGSAAWSCAARDSYIGWSFQQRKNKLHYLTNNTRFLIAPWCKIPHLASHILGSISRRINADWQRKYGHALAALETFVEKDRFKGTCYKAANWQYLGETTGRSRNGKCNAPLVPIKDIYILPLQKKYKEILCNETN